MQAFNAGYPASQPAEIIVTLSTGGSRSTAADDVPWLAPPVIQQRFIEVASRWAGEEAAFTALTAIERLSANGGSQDLFQALAPFASGSLSP